MIYQIRTSNHLSTSKKYLSDKKFMKDHLRNVIKKTEMLRKGLISKEKIELSTEEIRNSVEVIKIDESILPEWRTLFGEEKEIT